MHGCSSPKSLYDNGSPKGIGLSVWRVNLGTGSAAQGDNSNIADVTRRTDCYLQADSTYDWTRCPGQQWFMQQAKAYGVDHLLLFSNSAPVYFTANGLANNKYKATGANLKSDCYDDFAAYIATVARHFKDEGYPVTYVDPVNEPAFNWYDGQEGLPWQNSEISRIVREPRQSLHRTTSRQHDHHHARGQRMGPHLSAMHRLQRARFQPDRSLLESRLYQDIHRRSHPRGESLLPVTTTGHSATTPHWSILGQS